MVYIKVAAVKTLVVNLGRDMGGLGGPLFRSYSALIPELDSYSALIPRNSALIPSLLYYFLFRVVIPWPFVYPVPRRIGKMSWGNSAE